MGSKGNNCETCAQACLIAKQRVPQLEKRLYAMTIIMTVALTLAGQEVIKSVADYVSSINEVVNKADQLQESTAPAKSDSIDVSVSNPNSDVPSVVSAPVVPLAEQLKPKPPAALDTGVTGASTLPAERPKSSPTSSYINDATSFTKLISAPADDYSQSLFAVDAPHFADPHSVLLTPSLLPFDVYTNTLGLGVNYGFGEYYGIDTGWSYIPPSIPEPTTMTLFGLYPLMSYRRR